MSWARSETFDDANLLMEQTLLEYRVNADGVKNQIEERLDEVCECSL